MGSVYTVNIPVIDYMYDPLYYGNPIYPDAYSPIAVGSEWGALQDADDNTYVPVFCEADGSQTWGGLRDNILRARFKKFPILPKDCKILTMKVKFRARKMQSLPIIAGFVPISATPTFVETELDVELVQFTPYDRVHTRTPHYITEAEYLADPETKDYTYVGYAYMPEPPLTFTDSSLDGIVSEPSSIPTWHPSYSWPTLAVNETTLVYPNMWNDPSVEDDIQSAIRNGTLGAIVAGGPMTMSTMGAGDISGVDISGMSLEITFQTVHGDMIPRPNNVAVATNIGNLTYSFTCTGKARSGVGIIMSWGSDDFVQPCVARAVSVDRDTWKQTFGTPFSLYTPNGTVSDGHGYYQKPEQVTSKISIVAVKYSSDLSPSWFAVKTDDDLALSIADSGAIGGTSNTITAIADPAIGKAVVINDLGSVDTWITSNEDGSVITKSTTLTSAQPSNFNNHVYAAHVVFNTSATTSTLVGSSGRVYTIDWSAKTFTYVRNLLPAWSGDAPMGAIAKGLTPNTVDILFRTVEAGSGATDFSILPGANIDGSNTPTPFHISRGWIINTNDWLTFDLEAIFPMESGRWMVVQANTSGASKFSHMTFINADGSYGERTSVIRHLWPSDYTGDQFQSSWADLGNGLVLGSISSTINQSMLVGVEGLTATRSDAILYINAPDVPDPVYPDGPLWYVSEPGYAEKWIPGFVWDGIAWQPCRMWDGTEFMESTIPLP